MAEWAVASDCFSYLGCKSGVTECRRSGSNQSIRVLATLHGMLDESGDPEQMKTLDLEGWFVRWLHEKQPELGSKTSVDMLRNPEGLRAVGQVLERMRGGLAA
jgi:hypothetical protein